MVVMKNYKTHENQNLLDVSCHVYGSSIYAIDLALINEISLTTILSAGQMLIIPVLPVNNLIIKTLESRNIIPATNLAQLKKTQHFGFPYGFPINL